MMAGRDSKADRESADWASLFGSNSDIFVMIVVYADESGTHDPEGKLAGSRYPIIAGFAARKSVWRKFRRGWGPIRAVSDIHAKVKMIDKPDDFAVVDDFALVN